MEIETRDFGMVEIDEDNIIKFPQGIPGFVDCREFVLLPLGDESPFIVMQSVTEPGLAFITMEPWSLVSNYEFEINENIEKILEIEEPGKVTVLAIATFKDNIEEMTVNLAAPLLLNMETGMGKQVILDSEKYPVHFQVFPSKVEKVAE